MAAAPRKIAKPKPTKEVEATPKAIGLTGRKGGPPAISVTLAANIPKDLDLEAIAARRGKPLAAIEWVFNQLLYVDLGRTLDWASAPCAGAISLLLSAAGNQTNRADFWRIWSRTVPTKSTIEKQERFHDDGRDTLDTIERWETGQAAAGVFGMGPAGADKPSGNGRGDSSKW